MEEKALNVTIYRCPFCKGETWFDRPYQLAQHLYKEHLIEALNEVAERNRHLTTLKNRRWFIK